MKRSILFNRCAIMAVLGAGLALAACNQAPTATQAPPPQAALPLSTATQPIVDAPSATALPPAPRARVSRLADQRESYGYADQAYETSYGFGDAPPDYTFDYDGERPWVWRADDDTTQLVEPLGGGDRYYYYQPGQDYPYLVRDTDYSYGFDNGVLVVVYDRGGRVMPPEFVERRADYAGRYLYRGRDLYEASRQRQHEAVAAANWDARRGLILAAVGLWASQQNQYPDWRAYHDAHADQDQAHWDQERFRREAEAARTYQMLNDQQGAQRALQAAQQAQSDARTRGQTVATTGGQRGGFMGQVLGQKNNPSANPAPADGQVAPQFNRAPSTPAAGGPSYAQRPVGPGIQQQEQGQRQPPYGQPGARPALQSQQQAQAQAQAQGRAQQQALARQQQEANARNQTDAARLQAQDQARLQAQDRTRLQAQDQARLQAQDQARLQTQAQARQQQQASVRAQQEAQARQQQQASVRAQQEAQVRQQQQAAVRTQQQPQARQEQQAAAKAQQAQAAKPPADKNKGEPDHGHAEHGRDAPPGNKPN